jgi:two-component system, OmpR family, sensor histidine kinase CreC
MSRRVPILAKLLGAFLVPAVATFAGFGLLAHRTARRALDEELGRRLTSVAASAAAQIADESLVLLQKGDEETRTYRNVRRRLDELRQATGIGRLFVFTKEGNESRADTQDGTPIGTPYFRLSADASEVRAAFAGTPTASVLFPGRDGKLYKSGYAAVPGSPIEFAVAAEAAASYFDELAEFRNTLFATGAGGALLVVVLSVLVARRLVSPLKSLESAAAEIGRGDLGHAISASSRDEIGTVAETMEAMRQQLRTRDERMQMMLAGIAHEVRNPLGGMALYAGLLRDDLSQDPPDTKDALPHVKRIEHELEQLKAIVGDFLEYARRPKPELVPHDLGALCADVRDLVAAAAAPRQVQVSLETEPVRAACDEGQLKRALLNLVQNAVQACPDDGSGKVTLACGRSGGEVVLTVRDTGPGMDSSQLERIFTPFYTTKQKGTGLGLAFVRDIARDHGARLDVSSTPGQGTTFTLALPEV